VPYANIRLISQNYTYLMNPCIFALALLAHVLAADIG